MTTVVKTADLLAAYNHSGWGETADLLVLSAAKWLIS